MKDANVVDDSVSASAVAWTPLRCLTSLTKRLSSVFSPTSRRQLLYFSYMIICQLGSSFREGTSALDLVSQTFGVSGSSDLFSSPWPAPLWKSEQRRYLLRVTKPVRPPEREHQSDVFNQAVPFLTLVIQSMILLKANATGNVRY